MIEDYDYALTTNSLLRNGFISAHRPWGAPEKAHKPLYTPEQQAEIDRCLCCKKKKCIWNGNCEGRGKKGGRDE